MNFFERLFGMAFLTVLASVSLIGQTCETAGCQDQSFGVGGEITLTSPATEGPRVMRLQSDNKIVALVGVNVANTNAGHLIRMEPDGRHLDGTFGNGGIVALPWGGASGRVLALGLQVVEGDERFVVAGWAPCGRKTCTRVERYTSTGALDTSFGNGGVLIINNANWPTSITVLPDQRVLLTGSSAIFKLTVKGQLDVSFGSSGVSSAVSAIGARGPAVVLSTGRFLIPGTLSRKGATDLAVGRFNVNGSLDDGGRGDSTPGDSFGSAGLATMHLPMPTFADALAVDSAGNIIVACVRGTYPAFTVRFTSNGQRDIDYPMNSLTGLSSSFFSEMVLQKDGKIVVAGQGQIVSGMPPDALLARYNPDGTVDTTFGTNGWVLKDYYAAYNFAYSLAMQPAPTEECPFCEKILVNGGATIPTSSPGTYEVNFIRYLP